MNSSADPNSLRKRDTIAWAAVFDEHVNSTYAFIAYLVNGEQELAEELHQETWLTAMSCIEQFDADRGNLRQWLFGIARNRVALAYRGRSRGLESLVTDRDTAACRDQAIVPDDVAEQVERKAAVQAALVSLEEDARQALVARVVDGESLGTIAGRLGRSPKAVESLIYRAKDQMRKLLSWYFPEQRGVIRCKRT